MTHDWIGTLRTVLWHQFGAAIDTLENAIRACPDDLWAPGDDSYPYWYWASHTLFWLDLYLSESPVGFAPPPPFGMEETDPAGVMPPRVYTKDELLTYLAHGRAKCRARIEGLTEETALTQRFKSGSRDLNVIEMMLYNLRHVQHHAAQLNLVLRQKAGIGARWVGAARD